MDAAALIAFQAHCLQHFQHLGTDDVLRQLFQTQAEGHILKHVEMREQRVFLEHRVHLPLIGRQVRNVLAIEKDIAGFRGDKACNHAQSRGFSTARWAKEGDELLVVNVQRKAVQNLFTIKINNNVFERYDQIFIHYHASPFAEISHLRYGAGSSSGPALVSMGQRQLCHPAKVCYTVRKHA